MSFFFSLTIRLKTCLLVDFNVQESPRNLIQEVWVGTWDSVFLTRLQRSPPSLSVKWALHEVLIFLHLSTMWHRPHHPRSLDILDTALPDFFFSCLSFSLSFSGSSSASCEQLEFFKAQFPSAFHLFQTLPIGQRLSTEVYFVPQRTFGEDGWFPQLEGRRCSPWYLVGRGWDAAEYPTMHRTALPSKHPPTHFIPTKAFWSVMLRLISSTLGQCFSHCSMPWQPPGSVVAFRFWFRRYKVSFLRSFQEVPMWWSRDHTLDRKTLNYIISVQGVHHCLPSQETWTTYL